MACSFRVFAQGQDRSKPIVDLRAVSGKPAARARTGNCRHDERSRPTGHEFEHFLGFSESPLAGEAGQLRKQVGQNVAMHVGQAALNTIVVIGQPRVVDAQQVQDRGVEIVYIDGLLGDLPADLSEHHTPLRCRRPAPASQTLNASGL